jgi:hypothetical protein
MTYGMRSSTMTKANRSAARRYERHILLDLMNASNDYNNEPIEQLLEGRTISKRI